MILLKRLHLEQNLVFVILLLPEGYGYPEFVDFDEDDDDDFETETGYKVTFGGKNITEDIY